ncbi:hypothetical protein GCM10009000_005340 [Halobacterium noricense]
MRDAVTAALASAGAWASAAAVRYGDGGDADPSADALAVAREVAVDGATEGVIVVDDDGVVLECNGTAADAMGIDPELAVGEPIATLDPEIAARIGEAVDAAGDEPFVDGDEPVADEDEQVADEDEQVAADTGTATDVDATGTPRLTRMTDEGKRHYELRVSRFDRTELAGLVLTFRDVTDEHRLRRRVGVLNRLLRHDLRNEMNVVLGYTELIEDRLRREAAGSDAPEDAPDDEAATALERVTGAAETMLDRAQTVRHVEATLDADVSARSRLDVAGLVRAQVDGLAMEYPSADPQVTVDAPESAWITATGLIDTVFVNLLENAIEHSHRERPAIEVTVTESGEYVAVTVADDGPGIPSQELRTFQTEAETAVTHSSGLGLWLVVWVTEESGGRVSFDIDETGTAVTVEFPAADPPE